jgi:hypothetical protein
MTKRLKILLIRLCLIVSVASSLQLLYIATASAHHVLGRPAYGLNEDSNTPPAQQAEARVGDFILTYMVFPAFPRPGEPGRIHLYAVNVEDGAPFTGKINFSAKPTSWLPWKSGKELVLGEQPVDASVFRQSYLFKNSGEYLIHAEFSDKGESHTLVFPLQVGDPAFIGPTGVAVTGVIFVLLCITFLQRRRFMSGKIRNAVTTRQ